MVVGSLFSGIGGFDLGFQRAGMRTAWMVERNPYRRRVLAQHFPDAELLRDVRSVNYARLEAVDLICGGFPCTDLSLARNRAEGLKGRHSGLWREFARAIRSVRPRWVVVENVPPLLGRGLDAVLGDLASVGYDAEWDCIPAASIGAPHPRDRLWLVAYPGGERRQQDAGGPHAAQGVDAGGRAEEADLAGGDGAGSRARPVADTEGELRGAGSSAGPSPRIRWGRLADSRIEGIPWPPEPGVGRVAHGVPYRMDRVAALGDSLVPQIAEGIGRQIIEAEKELVTA